MSLRPFSLSLSTRDRRQHPTENSVRTAPAAAGDNGATGVMTASLLAAAVLTGIPTWHDGDSGRIGRERIRLSAIEAGELPGSPKPTVTAGSGGARLSPAPTPFPPVNACADSARAGSPAALWTRMGTTVQS